MYNELIFTARKRVERSKRTKQNIHKTRVKTYTHSDCLFEKKCMSKTEETNEDDDVEEEEEEEEEKKTHLGNGHLWSDELSEQTLLERCGARAALALVSLGRRRQQSHVQGAQAERASFDSRRQLRPIRRRVRSSPRGVRAVQHRGRVRVRRSARQKRPQVADHSEPSAQGHRRLVFAQLGSRDRLARQNRSHSADSVGTASRLLQPPAASLQKHCVQSAGAARRRTHARRLRGRL